MDPFRSEDDVKWKKSSRESCGKFSTDGFRIKSRPNPSPDSPDMLVLVEPKVDDGNP